MEQEKFQDLVARTEGFSTKKMARAVRPLRKHLTEQEVSYLDNVLVSLWNIGMDTEKIFQVFTSCYSDKYSMVGRLMELRKRGLHVERRYG